MRRVPLSLLVLLSACVGQSADLPLAAAPSQPIPAVATIEALVAVTETSLSAAPGTMVTVQVKVTKTGGAPMIGTPVFFRVVSGGGVVQPLAPNTDVAGVATATWTLGPQPATNLLSASAGSVSPVTFTAAANAP